MEVLVGKGASEYLDIILDHLEGAFSDEGIFTEEHMNLIDSMSRCESVVLTEFGDSEVTLEFNVDGETLNWVIRDGSVSWHWRSS